MYRKYADVILTVLISVAVASQSEAAGSALKGFRGSAWGSTPEQVMSTEGVKLREPFCFHALDDKDDLCLARADSMFGCVIEVQFIFIGGRLEAGRFGTCFESGARMRECGVDWYAKLRGAIVQTYGFEPKVIRVDKSKPGPLGPNEGAPVEVWHFADGAKIEMPGYICVDYYGPGYVKARKSAILREMKGKI